MSNVWAVIALLFPLETKQTNKKKYKKKPKANFQ
jgi:hypothetical protein